MSLEFEHERPRQINESESLQIIIEKHVPYIIKSMYPEKKLSTVLDKHAKIFACYTAECEYQLDFRTKDKDKPINVATKYHPTQVKNHNKNRELERNGYKVYKIDNLTIITYNFIRKTKTIIYKKHVPKPMTMNKILQLVDRNPDSFNAWGCKIKCVKSPCFL